MAGALAPLKQKGAIERVDTYTCARILTAGATSYDGLQFFGGHTHSATEPNELPNGYLPNDQSGRIIGLMSSFSYLDEVTAGELGAQFRHLNGLINLSRVEISINGQHFMSAPLKCFTGPDLVIQGVSDTNAQSVSGMGTNGSYPMPFLEHQIGSRQIFTARVYTLRAIEASAPTTASMVALGLHASFRTLSPFYAAE